MCSITENIFNIVSSKFNEDKRLQKKFNVNIKKDIRYIIGTTNIFPKIKYRNEIFFEIVKLIETELTDTKKFYGEIQKIEIKKGENIDIGIKQVEIINGRYYELYCYKCYSLIFLRLWLEKGLAVSKNKIWISIDIDEILDTPWFYM